MDARSYTASSAFTPTSGTSEWSSFVDALASVVVQTGGCNSLRELLEKVRDEAREKGEWVKEEQEREDGENGLRVELGRKGGVSYAAIDERLRAREMFRED